MIFSSKTPTWSRIHQLFGRKAQPKPNVTGSLVFAPVVTGNDLDPSNEQSPTSPQASHSNVDLDVVESQRPTRQPRSLHLSDPTLILEIPAGPDCV